MSHREQAWNALHAAYQRVCNQPEGWAWTFYRNAHKAFCEESYGEAMVMCSLV